jgi:hypothetical protein
MLNGETQRIRLPVCNALHVQRGVSLMETPRCRLRREQHHQLIRKRLRQQLKHIGERACGARRGVSEGWRRTGIGYGIQWLAWREFIRQ